MAKICKKNGSKSALFLFKPPNLPKKNVFDTLNAQISVIFKFYHPILPISGREICDFFLHLVKIQMVITSRKMLVLSSDRS